MISRIKNSKRWRNWTWIDWTCSILNTSKNRRNRNIYNQEKEDFLKTAITINKTDQCDRDAPTTKRQINYLVERGRNIETADEMNEALQCANALCGFNSCVIEILEKKKFEKQKLM